MTAFDRAIDLLLEMEGGYVNDSEDPGGETAFGISKRSYPKLDIKALTKDQATAIYRRDYWEALRCDDIAAALAVCVFDCGVNQGKGAAIRMMQRSLNLKEDGILGPITVKSAANAQASRVDDFMAQRVRRYAQTPGFDRYAGGWLNRVMKFHRLAVSL